MNHEPQNLLSEWHHTRLDCPNCKRLLCALTLPEYYLILELHCQYCGHTLGAHQAMNARIYDLFIDGRVITNPEPPKKETQK